MKAKEQFPETWVEKHIRVMDKMTEEACVSRQAALAYMVNAKMISLQKAKKHGYVHEAGTLKRNK